MSGESKSGSERSTNGVGFLQGLVLDLIAEFKDVKKEVRESTKAKNDMVDLMKTRPCFVVQADKEIRELGSTSQEAVIELADSYIARANAEKANAEKAENLKKNGFLTIIKWLIGCLLVSFCFNIVTLIMLLNYFHQHPELLEVLLKSIIGGN